MKFDLLFSDLVALFVGFLGLVAAVVALQNALAGMLTGSTSTAAVFALIALTFFVPARRFLVRGAYEAMLKRAAAWQKRIPFVILHSVWVFLVTFFLLGMKSQDFFGLPTYAQWLFSPLSALPVWALFAIAFALPGLAFRPYLTSRPHRPDAEGEGKRGILVRMHQNSHAILIDSHPITERICKCADIAGSFFIVACFAAFVFSDTHASVQYLEESRFVLYPLTLVIFLLLYLPKGFGLRIVPATGEVLYTAKRKFVNAVCILIASYGLAHIPYFYVIPWGYNQLVESQEAEITYRVHAKVNYAGCRGGLSFLYPDDSSRSFYVCKVDPKLHAAVSEGDAVIIRGKNSYYGHSAESLSLPGLTAGT